MQGDSNVQADGDGKIAALPSTVSIVSGRGGPLAAGAIEIDGDGRIRARDAQAPLRFTFTYRCVDFVAEVRTEADARLCLTAELGKLPYSMEIGGGRHLIRRVLQASERLPHGRILLSAADDMRLEAEHLPPPPVTPASLMATLVALLLEFRPYLDLLAQVLEQSRPNRARRQPEPQDP